MDELVHWFEENGGTFDTSALNFAPIEGLGRGAVALRDLAEGHTLFTIPRDLTLSLRTSSLPARFGIAAWKERQLHVGWAGLILCMLWEEAQGKESKWCTYLASLPKAFDTPMFWSAEDLAELEGTAVVDKIGREQAEKDFSERVLPAIQSRPDLFPSETWAHCDVQNYHIMGSRILSRSFTVEKWESDEPVAAAPGSRDAMDVDAEGSALDGDPTADHAHEDPESDSDDEDDEDNPENVAMVPMADMLNARFESGNAKLFYEEQDLRMATTKPVKQGEQLWNTYGDPPNSDLLRRYGHVDRVALPDQTFGNPADIAEVRADLVVASATCANAAERVDWWLEEGGEDVFIFEMNSDLPEEFVSFIRLLLLPEAEWDKVQKKGKLPKPKMDANVASIGEDVLQRRLAQYPTTLEDDQAALNQISTPSPGNLNLFHALVVRVGEKIVLMKALEQLRASRASSQKKRKADDAQDKGSNKRR